MPTINPRPEIKMVGTAQGRLCPPYDLRSSQRRLNCLQFAIREPHHLQQQPAVAESGDLGLAEGARLVVDRRLDDFQVLLGRAEDQVEIAERIEISEIAALFRQRLVILA